MKVLTAAQMREIDRITTERYGVPSLHLMENAGTRVVECIRAEIPGYADLRTVVLCGKGNNGGDGFVVARMLRQQGAQVSVYLFAAVESVKGDAAVNLRRWREMGGEITEIVSSTDWEAQREEVGRAQIVIDALLGTGLAGPVEGLLASVIQDVNQFCRRATVFAVDIPSGLQSDSGEIVGPCVRADHTVTFTAPKLCHVFPPASEQIGKLRVGEIGTPPEALDGDPNLTLHWLEPSEFQSLPLRRKRGAHKGDFGHALIVAGSRGKTGAAVLAATGALRVGVGLATVATPAPLQLTVAAGLPEMMTEALHATENDTISVRNLDYGSFFQLTKGKDAIALGPGLSTHPETQQFVRAVVAESSLPLILDADGLNAYAGKGNELREHKTTHLAITPHPGEMARLLGCTTREIQAQRLAVARRYAADWNVYVVLKGQATILASPDGRAYVNTTGNPGMATGGTGDVLTGMLAGLTAQFGVQDWPRILGLGVYLHGLAGDFAASEQGEASMIAGDILAMLPRAFRSLTSQLHHA